MQPPCCRGQWRPCSTGAARAENAAAEVTFQPCNDHNTPRDGHRPGNKILSVCRETCATCKSSCNSGVALYCCFTFLRSLQGCPHYRRFLEMIDSLPLQVSLDQAEAVSTLPGLQPVHATMEHLRDKWHLPPPAKQR